MKKLILSCALVAICGATAMAQNAVTNLQKVNPAATSAQVDAPPAVKPAPENMYFENPLHDFGTIQEGPTADHEFVFVNKGKEPIIISNVSASCGCTTPSYSKDPVLPGKKGTIKASYNTQGRVAPFTKTITITSNIGVKVLTIKGEVEKAPSGSVPENNSMIKTH